MRRQFPDGILLSFYKYNAFTPLGCVTYSFNVTVVESLEEAFPNYLLAYVWVEILRYCTITLGTNSNHKMKKHYYLISISL